MNYKICDDEYLITMKGVLLLSAYEVKQKDVSLNLLKFINNICEKIHSKGYYGTVEDLKLRFKTLDALGLEKFIEEIWDKYINDSDVMESLERIKGA